MFFQTGGALGIAALTTVSVTATRDDLNRQRATGPAHGVPGSPVQDLAHALAHGWGTAFAADAGFAVLALLVALLVIHVRPGEINRAHVH